MMRRVSGLSSRHSEAPVASKASLGVRDHELGHALGIGGIGQLGRELLQPAQPRRQCFCGCAGPLFGAVERAAVDRLSRLRGQREDESSLVFVEQPGGGETEAQRTKNPPGQARGHRAHRLGSRLDFTESRESVRDLLARLQPHWLAVSQHSRAWQLSVHSFRPHRIQRLFDIAHGRGHGDPAAVRGHQHRAARGSERLEPLANDDGGDLVDRGRAGQGGSRRLQPRAAVGDLTSGRDRLELGEQPLFEGLQGWRFLPRRDGAELSDERLHIPASEGAVLRRCLQREQARGSRIAVRFIQRREVGVASRGRRDRQREAEVGSWRADIGRRQRLTLDGIPRVGEAVHDGLDE